MGHRFLPRAEDGLAPDRRLTIDAGGVELEVLEWGDPAARPLLYWHGMGPFTAGAATLNVAGPAWGAAGFRVIAPNAPGFGASPALDAREYGTRRIAEVAVDALGALRLERVAWVGFSWGGRIGLRVPVERLDALVLLDVGYLEYHEQPGYEAMTYDKAFAAMRAEVESYRFASWDAFLAEAREHFRWTEGAEERLRAAMCERDDAIVPRLAAEVFAGAVAAMRSETELDADQYPFLATSGVPVLVLVKTEPVDEDETRARGLRRLAEAVPQVEIRRIEGAGHNLLADAPDETIAAVREWLLK